MSAKVHAHQEQLSEFIVLTRNLPLIFGQANYIPGHNCVDGSTVYIRILKYQGTLKENVGP